MDLYQAEAARRLVYNGFKREPISGRGSLGVGINEIYIRQRQPGVGINGFISGRGSPGPGVGINGFISGRGSPRLV